MKLSVLAGEVRAYMKPGKIYFASEIAARAGERMGRQVNERQAGGALRQLRHCGIVEKTEMRGEFGSMGVWSLTRAECDG